MTEILCPDCPVCGETPYMVMGGGTQALCGNGEGCPVMTWDPSVSREENLLNMQPVQITENEPPS